MGVAFPQLKAGEFAVVQMEVATSLVVTPDTQERFTGSGEMCQIFPSLKLAQDFASEIATRNPAIQCGIYDSAGTFVELIAAHCRYTNAEVQRLYWLFVGSTATAILMIVAASLALPQSLLSKPAVFLGLLACVISVPIYLRRRVKRSGIRREDFAAFLFSRPLFKGVLAVLACFTIVRIIQLALLK